MAIRIRVMIANPIPELVLHPVADRGIANKERIPIQANETIVLSQYSVMLGTKQPSGDFYPFQDIMFWLSGVKLSAGDWILLFTGTGVPAKKRWQPNATTDCDVYAVHWGRPNTMFANTNIVPIIVKSESAIVGYSPVDVPQLPSG